MSMQIKREILEQDAFSSSCIVVGSSILHQIRSEGLYVLEVVNNTGRLIVLELTVSDDATTKQKQIDLVELFDRHNAWDSQPIATNGFINLFNKEGSADYRIKLIHTQTNESVRIGELLLPGDNFSLYPWRPGLYDVTLNGNVVGIVKIEYPSSQIRRQVLYPRRCWISRSGIVPLGVAVQPAQGLQFTASEKVNGPIELRLRTPFNDRSDSEEMTDSTVLILNKKTYCLSGIKLPWHESVAGQAGSQFVLKSQNGTSTNCRVESVEDNEGSVVFHLSESENDGGPVPRMVNENNAVAAIYYVGNDHFEYPDELHDAELNVTRQVSNADVCPYMMIYVCTYVDDSENCDEIRVTTQHFLCNKNPCGSNSDK